MFSVKMCQISHSNPTAMHKSLLSEWTNRPDPEERKTAVTKTRDRQAVKNEITRESKRRVHPIYLLFV
jgi:hypothetical protein